MNVDNLTLYFWSETIPNWLMAVSAVSAAVIFVWRRQDRKEAQANRESEIRNSVNAVWIEIKAPSKERTKWGILVSNELQSAITDLRLECTGNFTSNTLIHPGVQPGKHFFESLTRGSPKPWGLPTSNITNYEFVATGRTHTIQTLSFQYSGKSYTKKLASRSSLSD